MTSTSSYIGGEYVASAYGERRAIVNPATEETLGEVVFATASEIDAAVAVAGKAQREWMNFSASRRGEILWEWSRLLAEHSEFLAARDLTDIGKPITDARGEAIGLTRIPRYWAGMTDKILGDQIPLTPGHLTYTRRDPLGVVGGINAWNGPATSATGRIASAVACGNGVVLKPSEWSPSSSGLVAELTVKAGMPPGLVNVMQGDGQIGELIAGHPGIRGVSFTGSIPTGRRVALAAASGFKKTALELGGKSPNIVFADADIDAALRGSVWGVFANCGQVCCAGTRLLVEDSIADEFVQRVVAMANAVVVGNPLNPATQVGSVASLPQYERVTHYIDSGIADGARILAGGGRPASVGDTGYFVAPTVFADVEPSMRIANEEIFGPVLSVLRFGSEDEAVELANNVEHGLAANVWTRDLGTMLRVSEAIEVGTVWGNTARAMDPALPFEGFKSSGTGNTRGHGAVELLTRTKRITLRFDDSAAHPGWGPAA
jgi:acyl-CoA reductase-like NAD-dependent aldehyde dehydrogenase